MKVTKNVGLWAERLDPKRDNPREVAFAAQWERENERLGATGAILGRLLYTPPKLDTLHVERDRAVAATVVQWLGSNVGFSFMEEALRQCGYRIERIEKPRVKAEAGGR